ncbi:MAG: hypothetical protein AAF384_16100 [Pseudomonadota bacterium]
MKFPPWQLVFIPPVAAAVTAAVGETIEMLFIRTAGWYFPIIHEMMMLAFTVGPSFLANLIVSPVNYQLSKLMPDAGLGLSVALVEGLLIGVVVYSIDLFGSKPTFFHHAIILGGCIPGLVLGLSSWILCAKMHRQAAWQTG